MARRNCDEYWWLFIGIQLNSCVIEVKLDIDYDYNLKSKLREIISDVFI